MKPKKLTTLAIAAVTFSMLSAAALANPANAATASTTSANFTDLTGIDATLKAKIDAMVAAGVFEGVSENTFGIAQNMTRAQFAKVATLIYGITVDTNVKVSSFSDVRTDDPANSWAIPYIEAAKKAGLIDGVTDTTFLPGDSVTTGQLDTVLLKGLGKEVSTTGTPWYADAVKQAKMLGIHANGKTGDQPANRADLVQSSYTAQDVFQKQNLISVTSVKAASDNQKVEVTLNKQVDINKATLTLNKGTAVINTTTVWSTDRKSATLTVTGSALTAGDYNVTLGGLDASTIQTASGTFTVSAPSASTGNISIVGSYTLANVLDSGLTSAATGLNQLATKAVAEDPAQSKLAKEIELKVTSGGETVAVPGIVQSAHSSDPGIAKVAVSTDHRAYVIGNKAGTADISLIVRVGNGDAKQLHVTVTVKSDHVAAKEIKAGNTSIEQTVTGGVYSFNAYERMDLSITDNYGITYKKNEIRSYNFALGMLFITNEVKGDPSKGATGTVSVDPDGTVHVTGNVTSFELTGVLPTGNKVTSYVTLNQT
ncbi:S-layer homology domain-containing protein [Paenibacillus sedimenti]|uniref:S-layer homology domain-containing protein n=1 Tax=Paenibacillus sedimenti TaxID=2770274 RepID=A0A926KS63_9BACL|nr:S-layer homology domain-containing protein [Paenibacillus sedimenti]MBD0382552.1 S-layer homology domain-containing protein [Paenibacillus sedimenti]